MELKIKDILAEGFVRGNIIKLCHNCNKYKNETIEERIKRLDNSIKVTKNEFEALKNDNPSLSDYLIAEELIATDPILYKETVKLIKEGKDISDALKESMDNYIKIIQESNSEYLRERAIDMSDILTRLINNLDENYNLISQGKHILITDTLYPSLLIQGRNNIIGVIAKNGGILGHAAILCKSFDIPYVLCDDLKSVNDNDEIIIDTRKKKVIINPSNDEINAFEHENKEREKFEKVAIEHSNDFLFLANVSTNYDLDKVLKYNFDAVGLYRTEMIFMNSNRPLSYDEQYKIYSEAVDKLKEKFVCFRTFDVGDDKQISYLKTNKKGIDNYLNNKKIFETQVLAMLKANKYNNLRIMFPMIETNDEFEYLRDWVIRLAKKNNCEYLPKIGMMLETKSALFHIEDFIKADFISIGTNDLTHELFNIDRENQASYDSYIDDLLLMLEGVVDFCDKHNKCLSVCGELASIKDVAVKLYRLGIRNLSISPSLIRCLNMSYTEFNNK